MAKLKRALRQVKHNLVSDATANIEAKVDALQHAHNALHYQVEQVRAKTDLSRTFGVYAISDTEVVTKLFNGAKMVLDPRDIALAPHIILDGIWEDYITKAWLAVLETRAVVFDLGANFGYFGVLAAQKVDKKSGKVVFFEANPNLVPYIKKTLSINWLNENTVVENIGVDAKSGTAELHILKDYVGSSSMQSVEHLDTYLHNVMQVEAAQNVTVKTVSIDAYCDKNGIEQIDLMKMDIEGYEEKAYRGMRKVVARSPEMVLFVEFTKEGYDDPEGFYNDMLKDFGHVFLIDESNGELVVPESTDYAAVIGGSESWLMLVFAKHNVKV